MTKTGRRSQFLLYHCAYKCIFRAYRIVNWSFSLVFSVTEIFCAHRSDSSFLEACGRTWSRSSASSRRRSAWEQEPCAGRWHEQRIPEAPREIQLCGLNKRACPSSGCALWRGWPCPRPLSWRQAAAMLLWEPRDSRNFHMWSCCSQKRQRGIVVQGPVCVHRCVFHCVHLCWLFCSQ